MQANILMGYTDPEHISEVMQEKVSIHEYRSGIHLRGHAGGELCINTGPEHISCHTGKGKGELFMNTDPEHIIHVM